MDEENEIIEVKSKIDRETEELEARLAEEQEFSDYDDADTVERRIAPIQKELVEMKKLQKFAEERLIGVRKKKLGEKSNGEEKKFKVVHFDNEETVKVVKVVGSALNKGISEDPPQFVMVMGGVASGKTTWRRKQFASNYVNFDFGEICDALEKEFGVDSPRLSDYAVLASDMILHDSIADKKNIVIEIIGDNKEIVETLINKMKGVGYKVSMEFIACDPVDAYKRHLKAVEEDKTYRSSHFTQGATVSFFYRYFELGEMPETH